MLCKCCLADKQNDFQAARSVAANSRPVRFNETWHRLSATVGIPYGLVGVNILVVSTMTAKTSDHGVSPRLQVLMHVAVNVVRVAGCSVMSPAGVSPRPQVLMHIAVNVVRVAGCPGMSPAEELPLVLLVIYTAREPVLTRAHWASFNLQTPAVRFPEAGSPVGRFVC